jgi:hypothetical protein
MKHNDKKDFKFMCIICVWIIIVFAFATLFGNEDGIVFGHLFCSLIALLLIRNKKFSDWFNKE